MSEERGRPAVDRAGHRERPRLVTVDGGGGWRPTDVQALVLDAAFAEPAVAERAFARWEAITGFDDVDQGSFRLLPLVAHRFHELGIESAKPAVLQGVLRRSWFEVQMTLAETMPAVDALLAAAVDVLLFKGAALGAFAYDTPGTRPMVDLDVLVPERHAPVALATLLAASWTPGEVPLPHPPGRLPPGFLRFRSGVDLRGRSRAEVDLHWHATDASCWPGADAVLWESSRPVEIAGRRVRVLAPEDELLVACVHGMRWNPVPPLRWAADALTILRSETVDWDRVAAHAEELRVEPLVAAPLRFLHDRYDAVPAHVLTRLDRRPVGWAERRWIETIVEPPTTRSFAAQYGRYLRSARHDSGLRRYVGGVPEHLVYLLGRESLRELPGELARRLARRVRRSVMAGAQRG